MKKHKNFIILIGELTLCIFAIYTCIEHWINNPSASMKGTDVFSFIGYFALIVFFIAIYIKNKD